MVEMKRRARFWKVSRSDGRFVSEVVTVGHFALASPARPGLEVTGSFFFRAGTFVLGSLDPVTLSCFFSRGSRLLCLKNSSLCPPFGLAAVCISRVLRPLLHHTPATQPAGDRLTRSRAGFCESVRMFVNSDATFQSVGIAHRFGSSLLSALLRE